MNTSRLPTNGLLWVFATLVALTGLLTSCTMCSKSEQTSSVAPESTAVSSTPSETAQDLKIETIRESSNATTAMAGKKVTVHYTGRLSDGKVFDSSEQRQAPFAFILGSGQVIPGWEKGVSGMKVGERRKLTIPHHLAYGDKGVGSVIPPKSTLIFEVELLNVE